MGVSTSLIAAAIAYWITDHRLVPVVVIGVAGVIGFFTRKPLATNNPSAQQKVKQEANPNIHIDNRPVFENKPTIVVSGVAAPTIVPAASPDSRPKLTLDSWDTKSQTFDNWQWGFFISNHGETALDIQVQRFKVFEGQFACSSPLPNVAAKQQNVLIPVWLEGCAPQDIERWNLLKAMKVAFLAQPATAREREDYIVPIIVRFTDFDEIVYESAADLRYVHALNKLFFGATRQRTIDAYGEVLAFLRRTSQRGQGVMYFVEHISTATGVSEQSVAGILERLFSEGHVGRSGIEGRGSSGEETKWGYVYWYAHF